ncbi:MAG: RNA pseudouridine synthase [Colwellia sp.]
MSLINNDKHSALYTPYECHIKVVQSDTALTVLQNHCLVNKITLSIGQLKQAIAKGALWLTRSKHTQRLRRVKKTLNAGDELHFYYNANVLSAAVDDAQLIADLTDYSVWYKPYAMLSQGSKWSDHCTIARFVQLTLTPERPVFIVHRLDRAATGLLLIAHSKKAARALSAMFEKHALEKHYQIIIHGDHRQRSQPEIITVEVNGKNARSTFTCLTYDKDKNQSLVGVKIDTGRKHQIRIHAASIGMPVVGDRLYGGDKDKVTEAINLQLCAVSLKFTCPLTNDEVGKERLFKLPDELRPKL